MQRWDYVFILRNNETGKLFLVYQSSLDKSAFNADADAVKLFGRLTDPAGYLNYKVYEELVQHHYDQGLKADPDFYDELTARQRQEIRGSVSHSTLIATLGVRGWEYVEFHKIGSKYRLYTFKKNRTGRASTTRTAETGIHILNTVEHLIFVRHKGEVESQFTPLLISPVHNADTAELNRMLDDRFAEMERRAGEYARHLEQRMDGKDFRGVKKQLSHIFMVSIFGGDGWEFVQHMKVGSDTRFHVFRRKIVRVLRP